MVIQRGAGPTKYQFKRIPGPSPQAPNLGRRAGNHHQRGCPVRVRPAEEYCRRGSRATRALAERQSRECDGPTSRNVSRPARAACGEATPWPETVRTQCPGCAPRSAKIGELPGWASRTRQPAKHKPGSKSGWQQPLQGVAPSNPHGTTRGTRLTIGPR